MFDQLVADTANAAGARAVTAWARLESAASSRRLAAMADMLETRRAADDSANREQWYLDNWAAVAAEIGAAQNTTSGAAGAQLVIAHTLRTRLPEVAAVFTDGLITYAVVSTIVWRTALIIDPDALRTVDRELAAGLRAWPPMSKDNLILAIDAIIDERDPHAVRRSQSNAKSRYVSIDIDGSGTATLLATLFAIDATAFAVRIDAIAGSVCRNDPRTCDQRRADAVGAMGADVDHLACLCERDDCDAAPPSKNSAVVYVVTNDDTLDAETEAAHEQDAALDGDVPRTRIDLGRPRRENAALTTLFERTPNPALQGITLGEAMRPDAPGPPPATRPGVVIGGRFLPGALTRRVALNATIRKLVHPGDSPPEPRYTPSSTLAEFIRCRDLTCRFPGCSEPATQCDLDHTIPYPVGPTQASNLKCLCRRHHLLKTFWGGTTGWRDRQLPDGTVIWTGPDGATFTTSPGSRLLFPALCRPTAPVTVTTTTAEPTPSTLPMPRRDGTRAEARAERIDRERTRNGPDVERRAREAIPPF